MRVLLIYPNIDCPVGALHGLSTISGVLRHAGHETGLIHVNEKVFDVPSDADLVARVSAWRADVVGFSIMSQQYPWSVGAARALRSALPDLPLVAGGVHCTMVPEQVVADAAFDVVAVGEAELSFRELVDAIAAGEAVTGVPGMRFPARSRFNPGETPIENPVGPFPDLAQLPETHYELFDVAKIVTSRSGWLGVLTARGCPYKCTYCFNKEIVDRYMADGAVSRPKEYLRVFPVERTIADLRGLKERHPEITTLLFDDDLFTLDRGYVTRFCEAYRASGLNLPFVLNMHVQVFDASMARELKDAGCFMVKYGLESGSPRVRKEVLWRYMSNDTIRKATQTAHDAGLHTSAFVMFGLPTETREEIFETLHLCAQAGLGRFRWAIFYPFPGTAGHRISKDLDLIDEARMHRAGNYFRGSCLKLGDDMDLLVAKLGRVAHWWVNAFSDWGCAEVYRPLVEEVESWDRATFEANRATLRDRDREVSERLLDQGIRHYSLRYMDVMAVDSDYLLSERSAGVEMSEHIPAGYTLD